MGNSLAVQWLGLHVLIAEGPGSIPGQGTKNPQAVRCSQKRKKSTYELVTRDQQLGKKVHDGGRDKLGDWD